MSRHVRGLATIAKGGGQVRRTHEYITEQLYTVHDTHTHTYVHTRHIHDTYTYRIHVHDTRTRYTIHTHVHDTQTYAIHDTAPPLVREDASVHKICGSCSRTPAPAVIVDTG